MTLKAFILQIHSFKSLVTVEYLHRSDQPISFILLFVILGTVMIYQNDEDEKRKKAKKSNDMFYGFAMNQP